jgi:hypothetical protein
VNLSDQENLFIMDSELKEYLEAMEARLHAKIEKAETSLLTEFHKWDSPRELRARSHAAAIRALDLEAEALAGRVAKLEKPA